MAHDIYLIVAVDRDNGIGLDGGIPWRFRGDLRHFKTVTTTTEIPDRRNMVIMGRRTWDSLPSKFRPLPDRLNIVVSRNPAAAAEGAVLAASLTDAVNCADETIDSIFIIGGEAIYRQALEELPVRGVFLTRVDRGYDCDRFFPEIANAFSAPRILAEQEEDGTALQYLYYEKAEPGSTK